LLTLKINPLVVTITDSKVNIHNVLTYRNSLSNKSNTLGTAKISNSSNSIARLNTAIKKFFGLSTAKFNVDNFNLNYTDSIYSGLLTIQNWKYSGKKFNAVARFVDNTNENYFILNGVTDKKSNTINLTVSGKDGAAKVPFLEPFLGITTFFDSAKVSLEAKNLSKNNIELLFNSKVNNLQIQGKRIAETVVETDSVSANLIFKITPLSYCIDTLSQVNFNKLTANVGLCYKNDSIIDLSFKIGNHKWQELIESLPKSLFSNISGMRLNGEFQYSLSVNLNKNNPDSLRIESKLLSKGFYIQSYGNTNFNALNDTFTHKVYNEGVFIKDIRIGGGKDYVSLDKISPFLRWAIITSEDGSFYNHRGFDLDGIRYAMACNIKEKRFARGGSTLSQQLIKNLYLNRNKNITRKFEEFLIVWMIEHNAIVSKDRMLEIYLNIIEWGSNVYGVKDASHFYFDKKPNELSLQEALFLAYIVPRPTKFKWVFEDENHLKPFMLNSFEFVSNKMLNRGYITNDDYNSILNIGEFKLNGEAKKVIAKQDTFPSDTIDFIDFTEE
ncbi:MAG TPA: biosynthetic peptidoglycan transglycosylase, partial [Tenuifilaceae bacterium]|nr:biosynthetic peptidoglycan transglycosylase [Tenuifilaceae bacterium]HPN23087.1 biosynthetic peptidoglycan transglycosylase [Tenuifilaceae bacterium]